VAVQVRAGAVANALTAAGVDLSAARGGGTPVSRDLPALDVTLDLKDIVTSALSAPNTVGVLPGSDPVLKNEYLVYSAHMDHIGITRGRADSINNGADDDASGTAGVIELAEAFSRPGARPKRSIIFLTVSGEEKGLWGSDFFASNPPVPIKQIVADINIDMIGRNWPDTVVAIGKEHSDLGTTLNRVNAAHPELGMTAIDDRWPEERFYFRSDHYNFARKGVPILFFFSGVHEDYHEVTDSPEKINSEKEARILRLLFYLGQEIANAPKRPEWKRESYEEIVEEKSVSRK
jgi:Zn-dependent M28 family amino/carboxypeptidase